MPNSLDTAYLKNEAVNPTYRSYTRMRNRCLNQNHDTYHRYGGRGITVDPAWDDFDKFVEDMGPRPEGKTLDRKDNDKGYCKSNCRWATPEEQSNNRHNSRHITCGDTTLTLSQWAKARGIPKQTLYNRLGRLGWPVERALGFTT